MSTPAPAPEPDPYVLTVTAQAPLWFSEVKEAQAARLDDDMVRDLLSEAHHHARETVTDLVTAAGIGHRRNPRLRRLLKSARALKRDLAEAWADAQ